MNLNNILYQHARNTPQKVAFVQGDERITYQNLYASIDYCQTILIYRNISKNDCITMILPNGLACIQWLYAIFALEAIAQPLACHLALDDYKYFISDSHSRLLITTDCLIPKLYMPLKAIFPDLFIVTTGNHHMADDCMQNQNYSSQKQFVAPPNRDNPALYLYTSGSEAKPKRICRHHKHLYNETQNFTQTAMIHSNDHCLCLVPFYHSYGLENALLASLFVGSTLVIPPSDMLFHDTQISFPDLQIAYNTLISKEKIGFIVGVPYQYMTLSLLPESMPVNWPDLRFCFSSGSHLSQSIFDMFYKRFQIPVRSLYGLTETGTVSVNLSDSVQWGHVGQAINHVEIAIKDHHEKRVPAHKNGQIWIKNDVLPVTGYDNYLNNQGSFKNGWHISGDYGYLDNVGNLWIMDRLDSLINIDGHQINIAELERMIRKNSSIKNVAVFELSVNLKMFLVIAVVAHTGCRKSDLINHIKNHLPSYISAIHIEYFDSLPVNEMGKILKSELKQMVHDAINDDTSCQLDADIYDKDLLSHLINDVTDGSK